jgi:succinoglycan biosynthesis transport protein ExoP
MQSLPNESKDLLKATPYRGVYNRSDASSSAMGAYAHAVDAESGSFAQYFRILRRRKGTLALSALAGAVVAVLLTLPQTSVYRAQTLLEVENLNEDFLNMKNASPTVSSPASQGPEYNIRTYTTVLQSRPVLERAARDMKLDDKTVLGDKSPAGGLQLARVIGISAKQPVPPHEQALMDLADGLKVAAEPRTRVITVTFDSKDPKFAADFTNAIAEAFRQTSLENRWQASKETVDYLSRQMQDVKARLKKSEEDLQRLASSANLILIGDRDNISEDRLRQLQTALLQARADAVSKQSSYEMVATGPADSLPDVINDATLKDYQVELTRLRREQAELSSTYTEQNPKVTKVRAQIATLESALEKKRANIVERIRNDYTAAQRRERLLSSDYDRQVGTVQRQSDKVAQYQILKREVDTNRQLYDSMMQRVSEAGFASAMRESDIRVIEKARTPIIPYKPNFPLNTAFGLFSGLCLGIAFVVIHAGSDRRIQEPGDTSFHLNVPELGVIPASSSVRRRLSGAGVEEPLELTTLEQKPTMMAESFRQTLASILCSEQETRPRVIVVTSANPAEGKSTVISNLAVALAQVNKRVLLVDGDMRKPRLHEVFGVDKSVGFGEALTGRTAAAVQETKIPNLFLLPSGKAGVAGLNALFTPQLRSVLRHLKAEFDMILIDTPPMTHMPDARLLGRQADAVILVVAQNTSRDAVGTACQRLHEDGSTLLGTILNNWSPRTGMRGYSEYRAYSKAYHESAS